MLCPLDGKACDGENETIFCFLLICQKNVCMARFPVEQKESAVEAWNQLWSQIFVKSESEGSRIICSNQMHSMAELGVKWLDNFSWCLGIKMKVHITQWVGDLPIIVLLRRPREKKYSTTSKNCKNLCSKMVGWDHRRAACCNGGHKFDRGTNLARPTSGTPTSGPTMQ